MKVEVFLFGKKENCLGWIDFLNLEKVPFQHKDELIGTPGKINILSGYPHVNLLKKKGSVFLVEPEQKKNSCAAPDVKDVSVEDNIVTFHNNVSSNLVQDYLFNGFEEFSAKKEFSVKYMREGLLRAFSLVNLPYVHLWYYPYRSPTVLLFRQDIEYVEKRGMRKLTQLTDRFSVTGTYFVNISGEEEYDELIGHLKLDKPTTPSRSLFVKEILKKGNEVANHGYWHYVFDDINKNLKNINEGSAYLKELFGVSADGFASPGAEWNESLLKALEKSNLLYACNGCSDVVGFPFHPYLNRRKLKFLELVFYRTCDASFEPIGEDADGLTLQEVEILSEILEAYADGQIKENKPIAMLGHPHLSGRFAERVYLPVFRKIRKLKIPSISISDFSRWWIKREDVRLRYFIDGNKLTLDVTEPSFVRIIYKGRRKILEVDNELVIKAP